MERQSVTTDKDSGIVKDANDWATDARYPLSLLLRVIRELGDDEACARVAEA